MSNPTIRTRIKGLDGLRFLAALAVFGVHYNQIVQLDLLLGPFDLYRLLANGELAVAMFIVLSGFLLSLPFWRAIHENESLPDFTRYAIKRTRRIVPGYFTALILLISVTGLWHSPGIFIDLLLHVTFLFNFTEFSIMSINPPFWTLAVEIQFYLLLPLLFLLLRNYSDKQAISFIICLAVGSYCLLYYANNVISNIIFWPMQTDLIWIRPYGAVLSQSPLALFPHFLSGLLAGRLFLGIQRITIRDKRKLQMWSEGFFWLATITLLIYSSTGLETLLELPFGRYGLPVALIFIAGIVLTVPMTRHARFILDSFPLRWLGMISYGFYIYHFPCIHWCDRALSSYGIDAQQHWFLFAVLSFAASTLAASISYYCIERPVLLLSTNTLKY